MPQEPNKTARVAIFADPDSIFRFGRVLRHLVVGLIDQAVQVRLVSSDERIERFRLGPTEVVYHHPVRWPSRRRRTQEVISDLSVSPPTIVHALSSDGLQLASEVAQAVDADLVLTVSAIHDVEALETIESNRVSMLLPTSDKLAKLIAEGPFADTSRLQVVRPGILARKEPTCFVDDKRTTSIVSTAPLETWAGAAGLVESIGILRERGRDVHLFLLGSGSQESALRRIARERDLLADITMAQSAGDSAVTMIGADIFVEPFAPQAFAADALEAMAAGMAVVAVPDKINDHFKPEETCFSCANAKPETLATVIESVIAHPEAALKVAASAEAHVRTHHSVSAMAERTADLYRSLVIARSTISMKDRAARA